MGNVSTALLDRTRGQGFTGRIQRVMDSVSMWRLTIIGEMQTAMDDARELDLLQAEMIECGRVITLLSQSAEKLKEGRESEGVVSLFEVSHGDSDT